MNAGRKPLTGVEQEAAWKLARKHSLMLLEQGTQSFDEALFAFCADLRAQHYTEQAEACRIAITELMRSHLHAGSISARAALLAAHDAAEALKPANFSVADQRSLRSEA